MYNVRYTHIFYIQCNIAKKLSYRCLSPIILYYDIVIYRDVTLPKYLNAIHFNNMIFYINKSYNIIVHILSLIAIIFYCRLKLKPIFRKLLWRYLKTYRNITISYGILFDMLIFLKFSRYKKYPRNKLRNKYTYFIFYCKHLNHQTVSNSQLNYCRERSE